MYHCLYWIGGFVTGWVTTSKVPCLLYFWNIYLLGCTGSQLSHTGSSVKSLLNLLPYCFCFMVWGFFGHEACGNRSFQTRDLDLHPLHWMEKSWTAREVPSAELLKLLANLLFLSQWWGIAGTSGLECLWTSATQFRPPTSHVRCWSGEQGGKYSHVSCSSALECLKCIIAWKIPFVQA